MRTGNQEPTYSVIGSYDYTLGQEVVDMFEEDGGATFYPSQKLEMDLLLARRKDGSPAAVTIGISKPRQNGKSYAARFYAIYMGLFEHRQVLYSAHHSGTTNKMFKAMCELFESPERYPEFANDVKYISHARGYEGIYFKDWKNENGQVMQGGCIEFATRTNSGSRGGTYSVIVIDEAQEMQDQEQEAMLPVISAASNVKDFHKMLQQIYIGTPPSPTCRGTVFENMHQTAHSDDKGDVWWLEWSVETNGITTVADTPEKALELAYRTNPAMGYRIAEKTVLNEYETMSIDGFMRERIGWWVPKKHDHVNYAIDRDKWAECSSKEPKPNGKTAYGIKFSADGAEVALCGAVIPQDGGAARISLIEYRPTGEGIQWLVDWLNERYKKASCVVIDGRNNVDLLVDRISDVWKAKGSVVRPGVRDVVAAASLLINSINEKSVSWFEQQESLNDSAVNTVKRNIGGGWGFGGDASAPIEACALALWGAKTAKRDPNRKMRIV